MRRLKTFGLFLTALLSYNMQTLLLITLFKVKKTQAISETISHA